MKRKVQMCLIAILVLFWILVAVVVLNVMKGKKTEQSERAEQIITEQEEDTLESGQREKQSEKEPDSDQKEERDEQESVEEKAETKEKDSQKTENQDAQEQTGTKSQAEEAPVVCNHSYKTQYGTANAVTCPDFVFQYPDGWSVTVDDISHDPVESVQEHVELSNARGVTVDYWYCTQRPGAASSVSFIRSTVTKVADASFTPGIPNGTDEDYSAKLGKCMVAKIQDTDEFWKGTADGFTPIENGAVSYAVVPESYAGTHEYAAQAYSIDEFSFDYPTPYAFIASAPDGVFTPQEEKEVIEILKSFTD